MERCDCCRNSYSPNDSDAVYTNMYCSAYCEKIDKNSCNGCYHLYSKEQSNANHSDMFCSNSCESYFEKSCKYCSCRYMTFESSASDSDNYCSGYCENTSTHTCDNCYNDYEEFDSNSDYPKNYCSYYCESVDFNQCKNCQDKYSVHSSNAYHKETYCSAYCEKNFENHDGDSFVEKHLDYRPHHIATKQAEPMNLTVTHSDSLKFSFTALLICFLFFGLYIYMMHDFESISVSFADNVLRGLLTLILFVANFLFEIYVVYLLIDIIYLFVGQKALLKFILLTSFIVYLIVEVQVVGFNVIWETITSIIYFLSQIIKFVIQLI